MARGDPVFRKEDCSQYDVGLVSRTKEFGSYPDQDKLKFIENVWKPGELFDFHLWNVRILTVISCGAG